jgi:23S rRNA pseudouridine1911/1915/1917 synthase
LGKVVNEAEPQFYTASSEDAGLRVDLVVSTRYEGVSRTEAQRLIDAGAELPEGIRVNGARVKQNYRLHVGDVVSLTRSIPINIASKAQPEPLPLDIVYEDSQILVINKARGMVVHPAPGSASGTLVNAVLAHADDLSGIGGELRPGIVHRLDKDTGGLLVVAKSDAAHRSLQAQIQARTAQRRYRALLWGVPDFERATIDAAIGRHPVDRKKMAVITDTALTSRSATTELLLLSQYSDTFSLWEARLQTGRTHQIRVHCAYIRHPIVGDALYGGIRRLPADVFPAAMQAGVEAAINALGGQALHACYLAFDHPATGERMEFFVPVAAPIQLVLDLLETLHRHGTNP